MPVAISGVELGRVGRFYSVDPRVIIVEKDFNPRTYFDPEKQAKLEASIERNGLLRPLKVRKDGDSIILVNGEKRLRALRALIERGCDFKTIVVEFEDTRLHLTAAERLLHAMEDNTGEDLTPFDEARNYVKFLKWGWTQTDIAQARGVSSSLVSTRLALLDATPAMVEAHVNGHITSSDVVDMVRESKKADAVPDEVLIERARKSREPLTQAEKEEKVKAQFRKLVEKMGMVEVMFNLIDYANDVGSHELMTPFKEALRLAEREEG